MELQQLTRPTRAAVPTFEPVTVAEARKQLELGDNDAHDPHLSQLIQAAREQFEHDTSVVCATGTYSWKCTEWPCDGVLLLPSIRPVSSITSIVYIATDGTSTTWSSSNYVYESSSVVPSIRLAYSQSWPSLRGDVNGITVTFVAGYASAAVVPQMVKQAVLTLVDRMFNDRGGMDDQRLLGAYELLCNRLMRSTYP